MKTIRSNRARALAVTLLASPLALLINGDGSAAPGDEIILDPVNLTVEFVFGHFGAGGPTDAAATWVHADSQSSDFQTERFLTALFPPDVPVYVPASPNVITVENDNDYLITARYYGDAVLPSIRYIEVERHQPYAVSAETEPNPILSLEYDFAYVAGRVTLSEESDAGSTIDYVQVYAEASTDTEDESYRGFVRPALADVGDCADAHCVDFQLDMVPTTASTRVYGYAHVTTPVTVDGVDIPVSRIYPLNSEYRQLGGAVTYDADGTSGNQPTVDWNITANVDNMEFGGSVTGTNNASPPGSYSRYEDLRDDFRRQRIRGSVPGVAGSNYSSAWVNTPDAYAVPEIVGQLLGTHQIYAQHYWNTPTRSLRRPTQSIVVGPAAPGNADFSSPIVELAGQVTLGGVHRNASDFSQFYVRATGQLAGETHSGLSIAYLESDASFYLPVTGDAFTDGWTPDHFFARRSGIGGNRDVNGYFQAYDFGMAPVTGVDAASALGPVALPGPLVADLFHGELFFSSGGAEFDLQDGYISGNSIECPDGTGTDGRSFYAIGIEAAAPVRPIRFLAARGCYMVNASVTSVDSTDPANPIRSQVQWANIEVEVDGETCDPGIPCDLLDDVSIELDGGDSGVSVSISETGMGPVLPNFVSNDDVRRYNISVPSGTVLGEDALVCLDYEGGGASGLRLLHRVPGVWPGGDCGFGYPMPEDWCDITDESESDDGQLCGLTRTFSPFAVVRLLETDEDGDGVSESEDNCPEIPNADQADLDGDDIGDVCDDDDDGDGIDDGDDLCPEDADPAQLDTDGDGDGDACDDDDDDDDVPDEDDNCPLVCNSKQDDLDGDGEGDLCEDDLDGDGVLDGDDSCPLDYDPTDKDTNFDGEGDVCDIDDDGDGIADGADNCPLVANPGQNDFDGDGVGDACEAP